MDQRADLVIEGRSVMPRLWAGLIGAIAVFQALSPVMAGVALIRGTAAPGMIVPSLVGAIGAGLCLYFVRVLLSVPRPALVFRADRLEVARLFGKYSTVSYAELKGDTARSDAAAQAKGSIRLRELSVPGWVMTRAENAAWRAELFARAPWLAETGSQD